MALLSLSLVCPSPGLCLPPSQPQAGARLGTTVCPSTQPSSTSSQPCDAQGAPGLRRVLGGFESERRSEQSWLRAQSGVFRAGSCRLTVCKDQEPHARLWPLSPHLTHPTARDCLLLYAVLAAVSGVPCTPKLGWDLLSCPRAGAMLPAGAGAMVAPGQSLPGVLILQRTEATRSETSSGLSGAGGFTAVAS